MPPDGIFVAMINVRESKVTIEGGIMQIHLFISGPDSAGERLKGKLKNILQACTVIEYKSPDAFVRFVPKDYSEPVVLVMMITTRQELTILIQNELFWRRCKTILILPDEDPETTRLALKIRPVFMAYTESDFSDVVSILEHINSG